MNIKMLAVDGAKVAGFVRVDGFDGVTSRFPVYQLSQISEFVKYIKKLGVEGSVEIGMERDCPLLIFIGDNREFAFAISPEIEVD